MLECMCGSMKCDAAALLRFSSIGPQFQDHRTSGSGEDFLKVFTIYGHGGHFGQLTWTIYINFRSLFPTRKLQIKIWL